MLLVAPRDPRQVESTLKTPAKFSFGLGRAELDKKEKGGGRETPGPNSYPAAAIPSLGKQVRSAVLHAVAACCCLSLHSVACCLPPAATGRRCWWQPGASAPHTRTRTHTSTHRLCAPPVTENHHATGPLLYCTRRSCLLVTLCSATPALPPPPSLHGVRRLLPQMMSTKRSPALFSFGLGRAELDKKEKGGGRETPGPSLVSDEGLGRQVGGP